jgi:hypothetical protein
MNGQKPSPWTPALVGGAAAGFLSGIPFVNCLCCLWIIGGGILAAYLYGKNNSAVLGSGDGAIVGAFAGVMAAIVHSLVSLPFQAINIGFTKRVFERLAEYGNPLPSGWEEWFVRGPFSIAWFFLGLLISAAIFAAFGALGGVIGIALFGKKAAAPPTAPPQPPQTAPPTPPAPPLP